MSRMLFPTHSTAGCVFDTLKHAVNQLRADFITMYEAANWFNVHRESFNILLKHSFEADVLCSDTMVPEICAVRLDNASVVGCSWGLDASPPWYGHVRFRVGMMTLGRVDLYMPRLLDALGLGESHRMVVALNMPGLAKSGFNEYWLNYYCSTEYWPGASLGLLSQFIKTAYQVKNSVITEIDNERARQLVKKFYPQVAVQSYMDLFAAELLPEDITSLWETLQAMSGSGAAHALALPDDMVTA